MPLPGRLRFDMKLAFGVGQAAEGLFGAAYGTFLIFFYYPASRCCSRS